MAGRRFGIVDAKTVKADIIQNKGVELPLSVYNKTVAPSLSDDSSLGYTPGSVWVDVISKQHYVCVDSSVGAAIWTTGGGGSSGGLDVWQQTVLEVRNNPPALPNEGDRYLIDVTPTGVWSTHANEIAEYLAGQWYYTSPETGMHLPVSNVDGGVYVFGGVTWDFMKWELTTASGFLNKDIDGDISLLNLNEKNILVGNLANEVEAYNTAQVSSDIEVTASGITIKGSVVEDSMLVEDYIQTSEIDATTLDWTTELSVKSTGIDHNATSGYVAEEHIRWDQTGVEDIHDDRIASSSITQHESSINITNLSGYEPGDFTDWAVTGAEKIHDDRINSSSITQHEADIDHNQLTNTHNLTTDINHDQLTNTHNLTSDIDHDQTTNYVAEEHIRWDQTGVEDVHDDRITLSAVKQHETSLEHDNLSGYVAEEHIRWDQTGVEDIYDDRIAASSITQHESSINITNLSGYEPGDFTDWAVTGAEKIHDDRINSSSITQHEADIDHNQLTNTHNLTSDIDHNQTTNFVADEHVPHSSIEIYSEADGGMSGSGDLTGNFSFKVDITNAIEKVTIDNDDKLLIHDSVSDSLKSVKKQLISPKSDYEGVGEPDETNDSSEGFSKGSVWIDTNTDKLYTLVDSSVGAAVWTQGGGGSGSAAKLIKGGDWAWTQSSSELSFVSDAYIQYPGLQDGRNTVQQSSSSPITLTGATDVAYVTINDDVGANSNLSVSVTGIQYVDEDFYILARRVGDHVIIGHTLVKDGQSLELDSGMSWDDPVDASLIPDTTEAYDLGSSSKRFKDLYVKDIASDSITSETVTATSIGSASAALDFIQTDEVEFDSQTSITMDATGNMTFIDNVHGPRTLYDLDSGTGNVVIKYDVDVPGLSATTVTFDNITYRYNDRGNLFFREGVLLTNKLASGDTWSTDTFIAVREYKEVYVTDIYNNQILINPNTPADTKTEFEARIFQNVFDGESLSEKFRDKAETLADGTGAESCSASSTAEETFITLDFSYILGDNQLQLTLNGQTVSLLVAGKNDQYNGYLAEEVSTDTVKFYEWDADTTTKTALTDDLLIKVIKDTYFVSDLGNIRSDLIPGASGYYNLGSPELPWKEGYFTGSTIYVGDGAIRYDSASSEIQIQNDTAVSDSWEPMTSTPVGAIMAWMGGYFLVGGSFISVYGNTVSEVNTHLNPKGWVVCDGVEYNNSKSPIFNGAGRYLPDLTDDRFLMGGTSAGIGGGSNTLLDHTHGFSLTAAGQTHSGNSSSVSSDGNHRHNINLGDNNDYHQYARWGGNNVGGAVYGLTNYAGSHNHTVSISHTHSSSVVTGTVGTGSAASSTENRPKYISCFYILKVR